MRFIKQRNRPREGDGFCQGEHKRFKREADTANIRLFPGNIFRKQAPALFSMVFKKAENLETKTAFIWPLHRLRLFHPL